MDFSNYTCPVCGKPFESGDDIVVCPECGTPHHRSCYEEKGSCFYEDRHKDGFSFDNDRQTSDSTEQNGAAFAVCPRCGTENEKTAFYCDNCGYPLNERDRSQTDGNQNRSNFNQNSYGQNGYQGMPFGFGAAGNPMFDPLAGFKGEDEVCDNVTAAEAAKFTGKNTQYFLRVFSRIKNTGSSRFNFSALIFPEVYFLYRKMTVAGLIVTILFMATTVFSSAIMMSPDWISQYNSLLSSINSGARVSVFSSEFSFMYLPLALQGLQLVLRIFCGLFANRLYYRHSVKKINAVKNDSDIADKDKALEERGGVNLPLAASFYAASMIISFICNYVAQTGFF